MRKRHTIEERIQAVGMCQRGYSADHVSRELGIKDHYVREWVERYRMYGMEGLEKQPLQGLGLVSSNKKRNFLREKRG